MTTQQETTGKAPARTLSTEWLPKADQYLTEAAPASDASILELMENLRKMRGHDHPAREDWFCINLTGVAGDRMQPVLARLIQAEAQIAELTSDLGDAIKERDEYHDRLDELAYAVAPVEDIGEHSSGNDPWANALDLITPAAQVQELRDKLTALTPPEGASNEDHLARLLEVFTIVAGDLHDRGPDVVARQLHLYLTGAMWAIERENARAIDLAEQAQALTEQVQAENARLREQLERVPADERGPRCQEVCLKHGHTCDRDPLHLSDHRDVQQKGAETCSWPPAEVEPRRIATELIREHFRDTARRHTRLVVSDAMDVLKGRREEYASLVEETCGWIDRAVLTIAFREEPARAGTP